MISTEVGNAVLDFFENVDSEPGAVISLVYIADGQSTPESIRDLFRKASQKKGFFIKRNLESTLTITMTVPTNGPIQITYTED